MIVTVAAPAGAVFEGVGADGLALVLDEFPLQPHAAKIRPATASLRSRITSALRKRDAREIPDRIGDLS